MPKPGPWHLCCRTAASMTLRCPSQPLSADTPGGTSQGAALARSLGLELMSPVATHSQVHHPSFMPSCISSSSKSSLSTYYVPRAALAPGNSVQNRPCPLGAACVLLSMCVGDAGDRHPTNNVNYRACQLIVGAVRKIKQKVAGVCYQWGRRRIQQGGRGRCDGDGAHWS